MAKKIDIYCTCGMSAKLTFKPSATPAQMQRVVSRFLDAGHRGDGHEVCDKRTCEKQKRRNDLERGVYRFG